MNTGVGATPLAALLYLGSDVGLWLVRTVLGSPAILRQSPPNTAHRT